MRAGPVLFVPGVNYSAGINYAVQRPVTLVIMTGKKTAVFLVGKSVMPISYLSIPDFARFENPEQIVERMDKVYRDSPEGFIQHIRIHPLFVLDFIRNASLQHLRSDLSFHGLGGLGMWRNIPVYQESDPDNVNPFNFYVVDTYGNRFMISGPAVCDPGNHDWKGSRCKCCGMFRNL